MCVAYAASVESDPDPYAVPAALLHDTVERTTMQWADLRAAGADDRLIALVDALTERDGETERDYLTRCAADPLALRIKRADIEDKFAIAPPGGLTAADLSRLYSRARQRLELLERVAIEGS